jgi:hypothetical protein
MNSFMPPRKKLLELIGLLLGGFVFYFFYPHAHGVILFSLGFVWNWSASNELPGLVDNRRYRMSMIRLVLNFQRLILKPFGWAPEMVKKVVKIFPAGIFWFFVIAINDADLPWWPTFMGSAFCELIMIDFSFLRKTKALS